MSFFMSRRKWKQLFRQPMSNRIFLLMAVLWSLYMLIFLNLPVPNIPLNNVYHHGNNLNEAENINTKQDETMKFFLQRLNSFNSKYLEFSDLNLAGRLSVKDTQPIPDDKNKSSVRKHIDDISLKTVTETDHMKHDVPIMDNEEMDKWFSSRETYCRDQLQLFDNNFVHISNATINTSLASGRKGGEKINSVFNQAEIKEYYTMKPGFFQLKCNEHVPNYRFDGIKNHLSLWLQALEMVPVLPGAEQTVRDFTIAITRYEYANLYHTMTDYYNAFLLMKFFNHSPGETNILFIDGHPNGALDPVWKTLFNSSDYIGRKTKVVKYTNLAWGILGYSSPMHKHSRKNIPYIEDFSQFFLKRYNISNDKKLNCDNLTISFIWRRDYLAHPRNPTGFVTRKIKNEKELLNVTHEMYPRFTVKSSQIDLLSMKQQLQYVSNSDILVGMHGAGLTHVLFLPKHAGLIEFYPTYWSVNNVHFQTLSKWRGLHNILWKNNEIANELPNKYTYIPLSIFQVQLKTMVNKLCPDT
ncbi:unnamed protein product [Owenia fusiformis]|uniref:EGF domain-specific O-linked N-acetylglucosamine transferase n=1 Tax=Owenia fusiformis TaxID=6347 RepID=A0A8S4NTG2_OWEFU|nr:unnamed protein product [Owenia fusiformis]